MSIKILSMDNKISFIGKPDFLLIYELFFSSISVSLFFCPAAAAMWPRILICLGNNNFSLVFLWRTELSEENLTHWEKLPELLLSLYPTWSVQDRDY